MSGTLSIHVRSGLCNRLRVVLSAIAYCEITGRELQIHWPRIDPSEKGGGGVFDASLSDLFVHPFREVSEQEHNACGSRMRQTEIKLNSEGSLNLRTINMFPGHTSHEGFPRKSESHDFLADRSHYRKSFQQYWSVMQPSQSVEKWIDWGRRAIGGRPCVSALVRFAPSTVNGVMTHDTNFETTIKSPPEKFIARIRQLPEDWPIFLAADCAETEAMFRSAFPDRIVQLPQTYRYYRETIQKRLAELYIAASCQKILGSYISSYSEFAGWLAGGRYSACYLWPADPGELYEDVGLWGQSNGDYGASRHPQHLAAERREGVIGAI